MILTAPPSLIVILAKPSVRDPVLTDSTIHPGPSGPGRPSEFSPNNL